MASNGGDEASRAQCRRQDRCRRQSFLLLVRSRDADGRIGLHHLHLARLGLRLLRKEDAQDAVAGLRGDVSRLHRQRQGESPGEGAIGPLDAVISILVPGVLELSLAVTGASRAADLDAGAGRYRTDALRLE